MKKLLFTLLFILLCGPAQAKTTSVNILFVPAASSGHTILRPTSDGYSTGWTAVGVASRYDAVDEVTPDEDSTYLYRTTTNGFASFYSTTTIPTEAIVDSVTVHVRAMTTGAGQLRCTTRIASTTYQQDYKTLTGSYDDYSCVFATNPATGVAWTAAEVNVLQWGFMSYGTITGEERATQCYASVAYH